MGYFLSGKDFLKSPDLSRKRKPDTDSSVMITAYDGWNRLNSFFFILLVQRRAEP